MPKRVIHWHRIALRMAVLSFLAAYLWSLPAASVALLHIALISLTYGAATAFLRWSMLPVFDRAMAMMMALASALGIILSCLFWFLSAGNWGRW